MRTDQGHCDACGITSAGTSCLAGACACPAGKAVCGTAPVDLVWNSTSCATWGRTCGIGETCVES
ncbi:MAG: hypothetical protein AB1730_16265 [Myxococcota bacterium]